MTLKAPFLPGYRIWKLHDKNVIVFGDGHTLITAHFEAELRNTDSFLWEG